MKKYVDIVENNMLKNMCALEHRVTEDIETKAIGILSVIPPLQEHKDFKKKVEETIKAMKKMDMDN